jgi:hypothetical protein
MTDDRVRLTIEVSEEERNWAVPHTNGWIASHPPNARPLAHRFVSSLTNPVAEA